MWRSKISKLLLIALIVFTALLFNDVKSFALEVTCQNSGCTANPDHVPLFLELNIVPFWSVTKTVTARNLYSETRKFAFTIVSGTYIDSLSNPLGDVLDLTVREVESDSVLYGPAKLTDVKDAGFILLSNIPSGGTRNYDFTVKMDNVGNVYQNKNVRFDINVGFDTFTPLEDDDSDGSDESDEPKEGGGIGGGILGTTVQYLMGMLEVGGTSSESSGPFKPPTEVVDTLGSENVGAISGTQVCKLPWGWWLVFVLQMLIDYLVYKSISTRNYRKPLKFYLISILTTAAFVYIFWRFFCPTWDYWVSGLLGLVWLLLIQRKIKKQMLSRPA